MSEMPECETVAYLIYEWDATQTGPRQRDAYLKIADKILRAQRIWHSFPAVEQVPAGVARQEVASDS